MNYHANCVGFTVETPWFAQALIHGTYVGVQHLVFSSGALLGNTD